jgi:hypothetical protein
MLSASQSTDPVSFNQVIQEMSRQPIALHDGGAAIIGLCPSATRYFVHLLYRDETKYFHRTILKLLCRDDSYR